MQDRVGGPANQAFEAEGRAGPSIQDRLEQRKQLPLCENPLEIAAQHIEHAGRGIILFRLHAKVPGA